MSDFERVRQKIHAGDTSDGTMDEFTEKVPEEQETDAIFEAVKASRAGAPEDLDSFKEVAERIIALEKAVGLDKEGV